MHTIQQLLLLLFCTLCTPDITLNACFFEDCPFNYYDGHKENINQIEIPFGTNWYCPFQLDDLDNIIFERTSVPYSYEKIINSTREHRDIAVIRHEYQQLAQCAREVAQHRLNKLNKEIEVLKKESKKKKNINHCIMPKVALKNT